MWLKEEKTSRDSVTYMAPGEEIGMWKNLLCPTGQRRAPDLDTQESDSILLDANEPNDGIIVGACFCITTSDNMVMF